jgi:integrase
MSWYRTGFYFTSKEGRLHIYKKKAKYKGKYKSNNWYGRTFVQNKQVEKSSSTEAKSSAKRILDTWYDELQFKNKHNMNVHVKSMDDCFKEYVSQLSGDNSKSKSTKRTLEQRINIIKGNKEFLKLNVNSVSLDDINKHISWYTNRLKKSGHGLDKVRGATLIGSLNTISNVMNWSYRKGYRSTKLEGITTKTLSKRLKHQKTSRTQFTMDEYKHMMKVSTDRIKRSNNERLKFERQKLHYFCIVMMGTGLRVDECMGLDWEDIKFGDKGTGKGHYYEEIESKYLIMRVVNSKTGEREGIGMGTAYYALQRLIKLYKDNNIKVTGNIWLGQKSFREGLNSLLDESGLKIEKSGDRELTRDSKSFRHSFIQIQLDKGNSATMIAKNLGTSTAMIDKNYTANMARDTLIEHINKIDRQSKIAKSNLRLVK